MQLIEQRIRTMVNEVVKEMLIERLIKVMAKLPNVEMVDTENISKHYKNKRRQRTNIMNNLGGYGNPIASFIVFDYESNSEKIHTITDNAVCIVQDKDTKEVVTMFPISFDKVREYWQQLTKKDKPKLPKDVWNGRHKMRSFFSKYKNINNALNP